MYFEDVVNPITSKVEKRDSPMPPKCSTTPKKLKLTDTSSNYVSSSQENLLTKGGYHVTFSFHSCSVPQNLLSIYAAYLAIFYTNFLVTLRLDIFSHEKTNVQQLPQSTLSAKSKKINVYEPIFTKTGESENSAYISDDNLDFQDSATHQSEVGNIEALLDRDIKNLSPPPLISINNNSTLRGINNSNENNR